jgi:hypothetical protein
MVFHTLYGIETWLALLNVLDRTRTDFPYSEVIPKFVSAMLQAKRR